MKFNSQLFGGGGGTSGGSFRGSKKPPTAFHPNSQYTQYGKKGQKHQTRFYDENGKPKYDIDYDSPRGGHDYPHKKWQQIKTVAFIKGEIMINCDVCGNVISIDKWGNGMCKKCHWITMQKL